MYADNGKLPLSFNTETDCQRQNLEVLVCLSRVNPMSLKLSKCKELSPGRETIRTIIHGQIIKAVYIYSCTLGLIKRWSGEFDDLYIAKSLLIALDRPVL